MSTHGHLCRVHRNGRIVYRGEAASAEGLGDEESAEARLLQARRAQRAAERRLARAEAAVAAGGGGGGGGSGGRGGRDGGGSGGADGVDAGAEAALEAAEEALDCAMDRSVEAELTLVKARRRSRRRRPIDTTSKRAYKSRHARTGGSGSGTDVEPVSPPPNFSQLGALPTELSDAWSSSPLLALAACAEVTVRGGEMLYLPCGWFHEVSSSSTASPTGECQEHCALNFWFHPPSASSFKRPYRSNAFWQREWRRIRASDRRWRAKCP